MNYKKILIIFISICFCALCANSADNKSSNNKGKEKISKAELRAEFKTRTKKNDFGDVCIVKFPEVDLKEIQSKSQVLNELTAMFLSYVDSDIDFVRLNKLMAKYSGAKGNGDSVPITGIMDGINKYLANKSMGLSKVTFSAVNFRQKLEDGVPVFCWMATGSFYNGELTDRFKERQDMKSADEWIKSLRKTEVKKIKKGKMVTEALCIGFNDATNEYLIVGPARNNPIWMTEKEMKAAIIGAYVLRY